LLGLSHGSLRDLELRLTGRVLAWVGAAAVILGAVFFLSLAFSRGWIGPEGRVAIGLVGGGVFVGAGAWLFGRRQASLGHVLVAVGLAVVSLALFAGTRLYGLFPPEVALAGSLVAAIVAAAIAVRVNSETVALFGLVAVAAAPPVLGAPANLTTVAFLGVTLVGTTGIALVRSWRWLPPVAFAITAPQMVAWLVAGPDAGPAIVALGGYWLLHALAASADEWRAPQEKVEGRAEILFLLDSILAVGGGLYVLSGGLAHWQGAFLAVAALAHFAFGGFFAWRRGDTYPFGLLVNAIGVVALTLAIERQFDGPPVAVGFALEAVVLAAICGLRRHVQAGVGAALLGTLATLHLVWYEYPISDWSLKGTSGPGAFPFADDAGLTLAILLAAGLAAGWLARNHDARCALATAGLLLIGYALPFELTGIALLAGWAVLVPVSVAAKGLLDRLPGVRESRLPDTPFLATAVALLLAASHLLVYDLPISDWSLKGASGPGAFPFADDAGLTLAILLAAGLAAGWLARSHDARCALATAGLLLIGYALPFELTGIALLAGWAVLVPASVATEGLLDRLPGVPEWRLESRKTPITEMNRASWPDAPLLATAAALFLAASHLVNYDLPISSTGAIVLPAVPFADLATVSAAVGVAALLLAAFLTARPDVRVGLILIGAALAGYACVFELAWPFAAAAWCVLAVAVAAWSFADVYGRWAYICGAAVLVGAAVAATLWQVAPIERLAVQASVPSTGAWFAIHATVAVCATAAAVFIGARLLPLERNLRTALYLFGGAAVTYLLSVLLVDLFQGRVGGVTPLEELQKQAQVGVSILWAVIGMAIFVTGTVAWRQVVREAGLALLGLATVKVFLFDLSYLDVAYRVLSLMGLGLLLLAGAYIYQSLRPRRPGSQDGAPPA
jgi:uncharacterized membrane protein